MTTILVRLLGWWTLLHNGDPLVWDRWRWLSRRIRRTEADETLLDVGCGSGAFTIGLARLGYRALGLSWDERIKAVAEKRARAAGAGTAAFEICDVRHLDQRNELRESFDIIICTENIEHIIDDFKLMRDMAACLKPGGRLLLTTPYVRRVPWSHMDYGPFPTAEDGRHVRRGYNAAMLHELCAHAGLSVEEIGHVSGPVSVFGAWVMERVQKVNKGLGWLAILPLRPLPPLVDGWLGPLSGKTPFCITLEAYKPRQPISHAPYALGRAEAAQ